MVNIGDAQLKLLVNLDSFAAELQKAMELARNALSGTTFQFPSTQPAKDGLDGVGESAKKAGEDVSKLGEHSSSAIEKMANFQNIKSVIDGLSNAFNNVSTYVMGFVKDFGVAEQSSAKLQNNLNNLGQGDYFSKLTKQASELSKITPFDDDDIINAQAMLGTFKLAGPEIEKLTPRLLDLTSAYQQNGQAGMNLQQVAVMIGKSAGTEMVTNLQRVGVVMSDVEKETLKTATGMDKMNILSKILDNNFKGLGETLGKTTLGQLQIAENQFKNMREEIGAKFAPVVMSITNALTGLMNVFSGLPDTLQVATVAIIGVGSAVAGLVIVLSALDVASGGTLIAIGIIVTALAGLGAVIATNMDGIKAWVTEMLGGEQGLNTLKDAGQFLLDKFNEVYDFLADTLISAFEQIRTAVETVSSQFSGAGDSSGKLVDAMKKLVSDGVELVKTHIQNLVTLVITLIKEYVNFIQTHPGLINALKTVAEFGFGVVSTAVKFAIGVLETFIIIATKAVTAISGLMTAVEGLVRLNIADAIFNPDKLEANFTKIRDGISKLKSAFEQTAGVTKVDTEKTAGVTTYDSGTETTTKTSTGKSGTGKGSDSGTDDSTEKVKEVKEEVDKTAEGLEKLKQQITAFNDSVDDFIAGRISKHLSGISKDMAEIDKAYETMKEKIEKSPLSGEDKESQKSRLEITRAKEIADAKEQFEKKAENEVANLKLKNEGNDQKIKLKNINDKYANEKKKVLDTYAEGNTRAELLKQLDIARVKEVSKIQSDGQKTLMGIIQSGWQTVMGALQGGFASVWESVFGQANSLFEMFVQTVMSKLLEIAASKLFTTIIDVLGGGGGGILGGIFGGIFGEGGKIRKDKVSIVGDEGPELFVPESDGFIVNHNDTLDYLSGLQAQSRSLTMPSFDVSSMPSGGAGNLNLNLGGFSTKINALKMSTEQWNKMVDDEIIPHVSRGLKRTGKKVLDDTIKPR